MKKQKQLCSTDIGGIITIDDCCREVRLGAIPCKIGDKLSGFNTLTDQYEEYQVVQVNTKNPLLSLVKRTT